MLLVSWRIVPPCIIGDYRQPRCSVFYIFTHIIAVNAFITNDWSDLRFAISQSLRRRIFTQCARCRILIQRNCQSLQKGQNRHKRQLLRTRNQFGFVVKLNIAIDVGAIVYPLTLTSLNGRIIATKQGFIHRLNPQRRIVQRIPIFWIATLPRRHVRFAWSHPCIPMNHVGAN